MTLLLASSCFAACNLADLSDLEEASIGIIGGADGPTAVFVANGSKNESVPSKATPDDVDTTPPLALSNPMKEYEAPDFYNEAGFGISHLPTFSEEQVIENIFLINNTVADIRFDLPDKNTSLTLRVAKADEDLGDISGVYTSFDTESKATVCGVPDVTVKKSQTTALALWQYDGFAYSLYCICDTAKEFDALLENAILYTMVSETQSLPVLAMVNTGTDESRGIIPTADYELDLYGDNSTEHKEFQSFTVIHADTDVKICSVSFDDDGNMTLSPIGQLKTPKDDYTIRIYDTIPEGMPRIALELSSGNDTATVYMTYDGRGERPTFPVYAEE